MKWASPLSCCHKPKMMGRVWRSVLFLAPPCVAFAHFVLWRKHVDRLQRLQAAEQILLSAEETLNRWWTQNTMPALCFCFWFLSNSLYPFLCVVADGVLRKMEKVRRQLMSDEWTSLTSGYVLLLLSVKLVFFVCLFPALVMHQNFVAFVLLW